MKLHKKARLLYTWAFTNTKTTAAIDITNTCNLKCSQCYWWKEERPAELGDEAMVAFMKGLRARGMTATIQAKRGILRVEQPRTMPGQQGLQLLQFGRNPEALHLWEQGRLQPLRLRQYRCLPGRHQASRSVGPFHDIPDG